ncbi:hypothetical protein M413DRAFT_444378 [Hebeloma cylindrosporum]|uniref:Cytochrome P450 n=1 Tax=Hebeloma cylindrosporum TaxID=76867 RepID=A0A0C3C1G0_HEBCY|nr:hypothetical protein M413DRAFT_444378 [Hebeloma cylindrosporum h7]
MPCCRSSCGTEHSSLVQVYLGSNLDRPSVITTHMGLLQTYYTVGGFISAVLLVVVGIDQAYQRFSHKWTNEPPLLPYRIPIIGHALRFTADCLGLFRAAHEYFPGSQAYSLFSFGKRVYVFTHYKDVSIVFRKSKALPFLPLIESLSGLAWDISPDGMRRLSEVDDTGDSIFRNAHVFYRDSLKVGPDLDVLTISFLHYLEKEFDQFEAQKITDYVSLNKWSKTMLGTASTSAMMGPALLRDNPDLLPSVWLVEQGFVLFVNRIPRIFAKKSYRARDHVLSAFTKYFSDEKNKEGSAPMMWEREAELRAKGISTKDIAAYSYAAYAVLLNNANPTACWLLRRIFSRTDLLPRLREEVAPAFASGNSITTLEQVQHLLTSCPLLRAFYDETLRLHSSSVSNRVVVEETTVGGYTLKVGHNVICPSYVQHRLPEYFGNDTDKFEPERFIKPVLEKGTPADPKMVRAFGGGVSLCPGRFFASNEVLSYAASALWRFDMTFKGEMVRIVPRKRE